LIMRVDRYKRHSFYALFWTVGLFALFKLLLFANYASGFRMVQQDALVRYQLERIALPDPVHTLLVGDSSLGNAVSAPLFSAVTGRPALSLALTGSFGVQGSVNMALRAMQHHPEIRNVVFFQTLDIFQRRSGTWPYATVDPWCPQTWRSIAVSDGVTAIDVLAGYLQFVTDLGHLRHGMTDMTPELSAGTLYTEQADSRFNNGGRTLGVKNWITGTPRERVVQALDEFAAYCAARGVRCIFVFGPMHEEVIAHSAGYVREVWRLLNKTRHLTVVPELFPLSADRLGDSEDHVAPEFQAETTRQYARRLEEFLLP